MKCNFCGHCPCACGILGIERHYPEEKPAMAAEFPGTGNCVTCGGIALCIDCNMKRQLAQAIRNMEADSIVRELAKCAKEDALNEVQDVLMRARLYVKGVA